MQAAFRSVTTHERAVVGRIEGDHTDTNIRDLGEIAWAVVKEALSGVQARAMRQLEACTSRGRVDHGLEAVVRRVPTESPATLLVEEGYRVRGKIVDRNHVAVVAGETDVRDSMDDAVDAVIARVLEPGGTVVLTPNGSLGKWGRIVLMFPEGHDE
jgi:hypothetical protein